MLCFGFPPLRSGGRLPQTFGKEMNRRFWIIAILGLITLLSVLLLFSIGFHSSEPRYSRPQAEIAALAAAFESYHFDFDGYPPEDKIVESLIGANSKNRVYFEIPKAMLGKENQLIDPWGTSYRIDLSKQYPIFTSAGPDRNFANDQDNISSE